MPGLTCNNQGRCMGDGYGEGCAAPCSMAGTCNNEGRCRSDGSCDCFHGFVGAKCDTRGGGGDPAPGTTTGETAAEPTTTTSTPQPMTTTSTTPEPDSDECARETHNCDADRLCTLHSNVAVELS
ncbi:hypothetical protein T484DRAFT_1859639 [Baffinella frigidus]|nr:hypothetical protein T484DRAFT_1859639 [Cryptophyta sp. CCMP2293]